MTMRFASIGSGSKGNGTVIVQDSTMLLVDCGFSVREVERRLHAKGLSADNLTALVVTHEHNDHIGGVSSLAKKYRLPIYATKGTASHLADDVIGLAVEFSSHAVFAINDIEVTPFPVPHDAREPSQFVFSDGASRLGLLTDTGAYTLLIERMLSSCDGLLLEANYDEHMLESSDYPDWLKKRISGGMGHLSNRQAAELLQKIDTSNLQHIVAMHLSQNNNAPEIVPPLFADALDCDENWIGIADQKHGFSLRELT